MSHTPRDAEAVVSGRRIAYRDWGAPDAPAILLLHGILGNSHEWDTVAATLADEWRVVVPDQRGHGASDWAEHYAAADLLSDLGQFTDAAGLDAFDLVGHSMGGIVAMLYAVAPHSRCRTLTIVDIGPETPNDTQVRDEFLGMLATMGAADYAEPDEMIREWLAGDPLARPDETRGWAEHAMRRRPDGRWVWRIDTERIGEFLSSPPDQSELWAAVERIDVPTLVLHGEHSWALSPAAAETLRERLRLGSAAQIDGQGHDLGVQAPEAVAAHIAEFLRSR